MKSSWGNLTLMKNRTEKCLSMHVTCSRLLCPCYRKCFIIRFFFFCIYWWLHSQLSQRDLVLDGAHITDRKINATKSNKRNWRVCKNRTRSRTCGVYCSCWSVCRIVHRKKTGNSKCNENKWIQVVTNDNSMAGNTIRPLFRTHKRLIETRAS